MTLLAAALAGFAVLAVEILGVHLLAPWFGASTIVWSQQIGLVLAGLAVGGWLGGRLAASPRDPRRVAMHCLVGGGLTLNLAAFLLAPFAQWLLPPELSLDQAAAIFGRGSVLAALLFFVPPVLFLAMVSPLLVQIRATERGPGRAAGDLSCAGTVGSLLGVFFSTYLAVPWLGVRTTLAIIAALLLAAAFLLRRRPPTAAAALLPLALLWTPDLSPHANLPAGATVLAVADSPYQHLRVVAFEDGSRWLQMNEGVDSYQSIWHPDGGWPGGYYDLFALAPLCAATPGAGEGLEQGNKGAVTPLRAWVLGFGAGSTSYPLEQGAAAIGRPLAVTAIELDPMVTALGERWMPLHLAPSTTLTTLSGADARSLLRAAPADLDLIVLDAYARQFEIPLHLATEEFFAEVASHLRPGGVFALNLGTAAPTSAEDGLLAAVRAAVGRSFGGHLRLHQVPFSRNWVLLARKGMPLASPAVLAAAMGEGWPLSLGAACLPAETVDGLPTGTTWQLKDDRNALGLQQLLDWREAGS